jgi:hypothetical protein
MVKLWQEENMPKQKILTPEEFKAEMIKSLKKALKPKKQLTRIASNEQKGLKTTLSTPLNKEN